MLAPPRSPRRTSWNPRGTLVEPWWNARGTLSQGRPRPPRSLSGLRPDHPEPPEPSLNRPAPHHPGTSGTFFEPYTWPAPDHAGTSGTCLELTPGLHQTSPQSQQPCPNLTPELPQPHTLSGPLSFQLLGKKYSYSKLSTGGPRLSTGGPRLC